MVSNGSELLPLFSLPFSILFQPLPTLKSQLPPSLTASWWEYLPLAASAWHLTWCWGTVPTDPGFSVDAESPTSAKVPYGTFTTSSASGTSWCYAQKDSTLSYTIHSLLGLLTWHWDWEACVQKFNTWCMSNHLLEDTWLPDASLIGTILQTETCKDFPRHHSERKITCKRCLVLCPLFYWISLPANAE